MRINWQTRRGLNWLGLIALVFWVAGCEESEEGCMDLTAVNYKVGNQIPCCCEYPEIVFQTTLTDGEKTISYTDSLQDDSGGKFIIRDLRFVSSDVRMLGAGGREYEPADTLNDYEIPAHILPFNVRTLNNPGANFLRDGQYSGLRFSLKNVTDLEDKVPVSVSREHVLRDSVYYDFSEDKWIVAQVVLGMEDGSRKSIRLHGNEIDQEVEISGEWEKKTGQNLTVNFRINVLRLFSGMDWEAPAAALREKFRENLTVAFEP